MTEVPLTVNRRAVVLQYLLSILKGNNPDFMYDKGVFWRNAQSLAEKSFSQFGVIGQTIF
jgi:hypothetical protein